MIAEAITPALFCELPGAGTQLSAQGRQHSCQQPRILPPVTPPRSASRSKTHLRPYANHATSQIHAAHTPDDKACRPALKALLRTEPAFSRSSNSAPPAEPPSAARAVRRKSYPPSTRRSYPRRQSLLPSIESAFIASGLLTTSCTYSSLLSYY